MSNEIEVTDRYGGDWPDPETACPGDCEGMGTYPEQDGDSWKFVTCPTCDGTGKRQPNKRDANG